MTKLLRDCKIGNKVKIISGLTNGCYDCKNVVGIVFSQKAATATETRMRGIHWCGWNATLHSEELIGYVFDRENKMLYIMNNDCVVEVLEDSVNVKEEEKDMKDMKDFRIVDYKVYDEKVVKTIFEDGTEICAVCDEEDSFDLMYGIQVCAMKYVFGSKYNKVASEAAKQIKAIEDAAEAKKKEEEMIAKKKAKNDVRMAKRRARIQELEAARKAKERQERIDEMKEAYLAAMYEYSSASIPDLDFDFEIEDCLK